MSRLAEARERLAALRWQVAAMLEKIRGGDVDQPELLERQLLGYREHESELVREIAELEGDDEGSAGVRVPRRPKPRPMSGAGAAPIPKDESVLVSTLGEPSVSSMDADVASAASR